MLKLLYDIKDEEYRYLTPPAHGATLGQAVAPPPSMLASTEAQATWWAIRAGEDFLSQMATGGLPYVVCPPLRTPSPRAGGTTPRGADRGAGPYATASPTQVAIAGAAQRGASPCGSFAGTHDTYS